MNFKTWIELKKVKSSDLVFTQALKSPQQLDLFNRLADKMSELSPSFSEGLKFLETGTDLILMGHMETLFEKASTFSSWNEHLYNLRFPHTVSEDKKREAELLKLPWPYGSKVKAERRGDKFGVELKMFVSNSADLTKILAALERVKKDIGS